MPTKDEAIFGEIAHEKGFVTAEQQAECLKILAYVEKMGIRKKLSDIMIEKGYLTKQKALEVYKSFGEKGIYKEVAGYEIISKLGRGGRGAVFKARQKSLDRLVAIKILPPDIAKNSNVVKRFQQEARAVAKLNHPNIVRGLDVGEADGYNYFVMELIAGGDLRKIMDEKGVLPEKEAINIISDIANALEHANSVGLLHRDIKPDNILIDNATGLAKLIDLGLVKEADSDLHLTQEGSALGTPYYISPEQARGKKNIDIRSDIYSLGATFYHIITGKVPFDGDTAGEIIAKHLTEAVTDPKIIKPDLSENIALVIMKMMAKRRIDRYQTPQELIADLRSLREGKPPEIAMSAVPKKPIMLAPASAEPVATPTPTVQELPKKVAVETRQRPVAKRQQTQSAPASSAKTSKKQRAPKPVLSGNGGPDRKKGNGVLIVVILLILAVAGILLYVFVFSGGPKLRDIEISEGNGNSVVKPPEDGSGKTPKSINNGTKPPEVAGTEKEAVVPAGRFSFAVSSKNYNPNVREFMISRYEVTNAEYAKFIKAGGYRNEKNWSYEGRRWREKYNVTAPRFWGDPKYSDENFPVVGISYYEAEAYCKWLTSKKAAGKVYRIPTEEEWIKAAYWHKTEGVRQYPWGKQWKPGSANIAERGSPRKLSPVGKINDGKSYVGAYDMAGNVWEWCSSPFDNTIGEPGDDSFYYVIRGGSWGSSSRQTKLSARQMADTSTRSPYIGFRYVVVKK